MKHELLLCAVLVGAALTARATRADACTIHGNVQVVTYWDGSSAYNPAVSGDDRCSPKPGGGQTCQLQGYYITPSPTPSGALPTVLFVHGSGSTMPSLYCETLNAFVDRGYVVFAPVMRGVAGSLGGAPSFATNTGVYIETWASNKATSSCGTACQTVAYMKKESRDLDSAIHWLVQAHPTRTDLGRLALVGHSYGGATVTIANASTSLLTYTPTVAVSLSGAGMSWSPGSAWEDGLNDAADHARAPSYFQRVLNESPIAPSIGSALEPYDHVVAAGGNARLAAYGAYTPVNTSLCNDTTPNWHNVHCAFVNEAGGVAIWIDGVVQFFRDYGIE
ncbi:MAG TPA: alpha/beta fold hydrolase [Kofleriaceae bacterium]|nr:alpha/beta fold hydrolase [Kofleriaceae bacterium]